MEEAYMWLPARYPRCTHRHALRTRGVEWLISTVLDVIYYTSLAVQLVQQCLRLREITTVTYD